MATNAVHRTSRIPTSGSTNRDDENVDQLVQAPSATRDELG
ncbi:hypothetical protein [Nocardioides sp.]|nr:hypothetical protein [Nocardioides sp.]